MPDTIQVAGVYHARQRASGSLSVHLSSFTECVAMP